MNKKRFFMIAFIVLLVFILIFAQSFFKDRFTDAVLTDNDVGSFKSYSSDDGNFNFSVPSNWDSTKTSGDDFNFYKINLKDNDNNITGYIDVFNTNDNLMTMAETDMKNISLNHENDKIKQEDKCVTAEYNTSVKNGFDYVNSCYYVQLKDGIVGKCTFISRADSYKDNMKQIFNSIADSMSYK